MMFPVWKGLPLRVLIARPGASLELYRTWRAVRRSQREVELARRYHGPDSQEEAIALDVLEGVIAVHEAVRRQFGAAADPPGGHR